MSFYAKYRLVGLLSIILMPLFLLAQEQIAPIKHNPFALKKQNNSLSKFAKTSALSLPFFEDFTHYDADPDTSLWVEHQVYINNTMGYNMVSRGVATFDALNQFGVPYDTVNINAIKYADSLTSKAIDLSVYAPSDSLYLSFFYQPAGNGFAPDAPDSLMLFFKTKTSGLWQKVWSKSDSALKEFKQVMIVISDPKYLHTGFQFRFVNKASIGINDDVWNVDYIRLDAGRNMFDTTINDVAYTTTPSSILKDYEAMPYRHYIADPSAERAADFQSIMHNNFNSNQNISNFGYQATEKASGSSLSTGADVNRTIDAKDTSKVNFGIYSSTPAAGIYDRVIFENKYYLQAPPGDISKTNDTIVGQQIFDNYLAYDDGTAEMSYYLNLFPTLPGKIAIEHHLNTQDTLRGLAIYFGRQVPLAKYKYFSIVVYKSIAYGSSSSDDVIYQIDNLQPDYVDTINHFWIYKFDKAVALDKGTFYIGTTQPALSGSDSLYFGLDRNRFKSNHLYYNVLNKWSPSLVSGALMIRPLLGAPIIGTDIAHQMIRPNEEIKVFPNPAHDVLKIEYEAGEARIYFTLKNVLGQTLIQGISQSAFHEIDLSQLNSGIYFLESKTDKQQFTTQKIIKL